MFISVVLTEQKTKMVLACSNLTKNSNNTNARRMVTCFISACRKLNSFVGVYAGLFVLLVPSVLSETDWPSHLTYDHIYNNTHYAQLQPIHRPYNPVNSFSSHHNGNKYSYNDTRVNEVDDQPHYKDASGPLLVGFARDPFRYSVPEDDYKKGVRNIDPQVYMSKTENRGKRGVFHLYNMLYCATGCDPLSYKGYGCYCGFLGSGRPTDGIDRCCKLHDECYENIYCPFYTVYLQPYYWKCYHGQPLCALENFDSQYQYINGCAGRLCECDRYEAICNVREKIQVSKEAGTMPLIANTIAAELTHVPIADIYLVFKPQCYHK